MIYGDEKAMQAASQDQTAAVLAAYGAYTKAISDAGVKIASQRLRPTSTATTVRVQNGKTQVLNGPYAEVKEQLGGFYLIDAPDLDAAISWAARCPGASTARSKFARSGRCNRLNAANGTETHEMRDRHRRGLLPRILDRGSQLDAACGRVGDVGRSVVSGLPGRLRRANGEAERRGRSARVLSRRPARGALTPGRARRTSAAPDPAHATQNDAAHDKTARRPPAPAGLLPDGAPRRRRSRNRGPRGAGELRQAGGVSRGDVAQRAGGGGRARRRLRLGACRLADPGRALNPEGWLATAARRRLIDAARRRRSAEASSETLELIGAGLREAADADEGVPDRRLALMFACAHPAIEESVRAPLMLQTIFGLEAAAIASAFLVSPAAMGQRLSRAKAKIRLAGVPFKIPEREYLPERLGVALEAIYAAFRTAGRKRSRTIPADATWPRRRSGSAASSSPSFRTSPRRWGSWR